MRMTALLFGLLAGAACGAAGTPPVDMGAVDEGPVVVNPFMGTGGFGYAFASDFPGASAPNGLAKPGPDTSGKLGRVSFLHYDGYWYGDDTIEGFSQLHLAGTGAPDYSTLSVMPSDGFDASRTTPDGYGSKFQKASETSVPGHYQVTLDRGHIVAELTATAHVAYHRYTYPAGAKTAAIIFDFTHGNENGMTTVSQATLDPVAAEVHGHLHCIGAMSSGFGGYDLYFDARFKKPWNEQLVWVDGAAPAAGTSLDGKAGGFVVQYDAPTEPIEIVIGLSMTSAAEASANLAAESHGFDFDATAQATAAAWDAVTGLIRVEGGTRAQQRAFVSSLHHAFVMPSWIGDVDGSYVGPDKQPHHAGYHYMSDMSLWDTYRTVNPLYDLVAPDVARAVARSLVDHAKEAGAFPKWPIALGDSGSMIGASAEVVLADAYLKGITGFDAEGAYQILRAAALDPVDPASGRGGRDAVVPYMNLGYVPSSNDGSVSITTEYGNEDFALGNLAAALGHADDAKVLLERRKSYRNLFDPVTGFLWAKKANGDFVDTQQDPTEWTSDFVEADAWQSVWMAAHDIDGLEALFGGQQGFVDKLSQLFSSSVTEQANVMQDPGMAVAPRMYYWAGNEPDIHAAFLFAQAGRPDLTQKWLKWIRDTQYSDQPDGIPGNDDGGTLASWYVWASLGLYPIPGSDVYVVGAPQFPKIEIAVAGGTFTIAAPDVSDTNLYVQSAMLDGAPLARPLLHHADLEAGGSLELVMGPNPSDWGR